MNRLLQCLAVAAMTAAIDPAAIRGESLVTIDMVTVGDAGNAAADDGYGAVAYDFRIGVYEVSIDQYTTFLNSVAASDPHGLYNPGTGSNLNVAGVVRSGSAGSYSYGVMGDSAPRPVSFVSWFDAARFCNWLHNGATPGAGTETGAYTLNGATSGIVVRNPDADWWIPSEDEWYKAAYYKGGGTSAGYWQDPTQSDARPGSVPGDAANVSNSAADRQRAGGAHDGAAGATHRAARPRQRTAERQIPRARKRAAGHQEIGCDRRGGTDLEHPGLEPQRLGATETSDSYGRIDPNLRIGGDVNHDVIGCSGKLISDPIPGIGPRCTVTGSAPDNRREQRARLQPLDEGHKTRRHCSTTTPAPPTPGRPGTKDIRYACHATHSATPAGKSPVRRIQGTSTWFWTYGPSIH